VQDRCGEKPIVGQVFKFSGTDSLGISLAVVTRNFNFMSDALAEQEGNTSTLPVTRHGKLGSFWRKKKISKYTPDNDVCSWRLRLKLEILGFS
jgi:hypothetical protein